MHSSVTNTILVLGKNMMLGIVIPVCNPNSQQLRQEGCEIMAGLDHRGRPCLSHSLKKKGGGEADLSLEMTGVRTGSVMSIILAGRGPH